MYRPNLKSVALPVSEMIAIEVLGGGCEPPILGKRRPYGVGDGSIRNSVGEFLWAFRSNFSSIFTRFRAAFVLQHATFSHPTSSLPKFSQVSLGVGGGWSLGYEERRCWANCQCS